MRTYLKYICVTLDFMFFKICGLNSFQKRKAEKISIKICTKNIRRKYHETVYVLAFYFFKKKKEEKIMNYF